MTNRIDWDSFWVGACAVMAVVCGMRAEPVGLVLNIAAVVLNVWVIRRRQS